MKLPCQPAPPPLTTILAEEPAVADGTTGRHEKAKRGPNKRNMKKATMEGRTFTEHDAKYIPPPPPALFKSYGLSRFDVRQIIYSGLNYDPWWDMPQLIVQMGQIMQIYPS